MSSTRNGDFVSALSSPPSCAKTFAPSVSPSGMESSRMPTPESKEIFPASATSVFPSLTSDTLQLFPSQPSVVAFSVAFLPAGPLLRTK